MNEKKKRRLRRYHLHPATSFFLSTILVMILSLILSSLNLKSSYNTIDKVSMDVSTVVVEVKNMFSSSGINYIFGHAATNFASFSAFINLMIAIIGLSVAYASGFIKTFIRKNTIKIDNKIITFFVILLGIFSSLINDVGYVVLIPLCALIYMVNKRSPLLGITAAFCGVSFGYGVSLFAGSLDVSLVSITQLSSHLVDSNYHVSLLSNIFIMIASSIILSIIGTMVIEMIIVNRIGKYKNSEEIENTMNLTLPDLSKMDDKEKLEKEVLEKRGLRNAYIIGLLLILIFIYMIIPGLPKSGLLLDETQSTYVKQLFGSNSSLQSGFTALVSLWFIIVGIAYGVGAKTIKNDKQLIEDVSTFFRSFGELIVTIFFFVQFISVFKESNIGLLITCYGVNILSNLSFSGVMLILVVMLVIAFSGIFMTSSVMKWTVFAPTVVPLLMQNNISPEFAQFILRASDSITKGFTPFLGYFIIYLGYMNIYNSNKEAIGIRKAFNIILPYFGIMALTWVLIVMGWYVIGLPIGPNTFTTI